MKRTDQSKLITLNKAIQSFRRKISQESSIPTRNLYIYLLNDKIYKKNRLIESIYDLNVYRQDLVNNHKQSEINIQTENKKLLSLYPEMFNIVAVRNLCNLDRLANMASRIKGEPTEVTEIKEYISDYQNI